MKIFLTGISGFVGAGVAHYALSEGHAVSGLVRASTNRWRLADVEHRIDLRVGDLRDSEELRQILLDVRPDVVMHLGVYGAYPTQSDAGTILHTTVCGAYQLLSAGKDAGVGMVVMAGSSSEYGTKDHPMREDERIDPNSYYAVAKAAQTHLGQEFARKEGLPVVTLRLFSVYGPYEEPGRLVPTVIGRALDGDEITLADPRIARDFVYLGDVARAFLVVAQRPELSGKVLNLGTGVQRTLGDVARIVLRETQSTSQVSSGTYEQREFDTMTWVADIKAASQVPGFVPTTSLEDGLRDTIRWYRDHTTHYSSQAHHD